MTTIRQRAVLRRRPRALPLGTERQWQSGVYVKVSPGVWARTRPRPGKALPKALPREAANDRGGLAGVSRAIALADGPQARTLAQHVVNQMSTWDVRHPPVLVPLTGAISALMMTDHSSAWDLYCARRVADFNDGIVDLGLLDRYVERIKRFYDVSGPEGIMAKAYSGPKTVADINLASWMQYFAEGGQLNQPRWLETNRFKELRRQFEMLANTQGG